MNNSTRHVDVKNAAAEEVLRQAVYLRSSLGRKASLQASTQLRGAAPSCWVFGDLPLPVGLLGAASASPAGANQARLLPRFALPALPAGEAADAQRGAQHTGTLDPRGAGCTQEQQQRQQPVGAAALQPRLAVVTDVACSCPPHSSSRAHVT